MFKKNYWLFFVLFLSGCYTKVNLTYYTPNRVTHLLAVNSKGDTVKVNVNQYLLLYNQNPSYYSDWRFYYRDKWVSPYSYYTFYHKSYYTSYQSNNYTPLKIETKKEEPKSRSTGKTSTPTSRTKDKSTTTPRTRNN